MPNFSKLQAVGSAQSDDEAISIAKPPTGGLDAFKSKNSPSVANVGTLLTALPHGTLAQAKDWVRTHPDDDYWSAELCFVSVPIKGATRDSLHLISDDVAVLNLPSSKIQRLQLVLATKPHDRFFLCQVPTRNLDNLYNQSNRAACEQAKTLWTQATSRKEENVEGYKVDYARDPDAFPAPSWPEQTLEDLILITFSGRTITDDQHPGLLRLVGAKQSSV
jgi:hypothetical protein